MDTDDLTKMKIYQFRVSIVGIPKVYRILEVSEDCTFDDLHNAIFQAFDRYDHHLYSFFITRKDTQNVQTIFRAPEITHPQNMKDMMGFEKPKKSTAKTRIGDIVLLKNDVFHYWFDFGDDWWHRIRVQNVKETALKKRHVKLINSVGESPPQYPDYDDEDDEYDEDYD